MTLEDIEDVEELKQQLGEALIRGYARFVESEAFPVDVELDAWRERVEPE